MTSRALVFVSLTLVACGSGGKSGSPGSGGSGGSPSAGAGGHAGTTGPTGGAAGGASGGDGCAADAAVSSCFQQGTWQIDNLSPCFYTLAVEGGTSQGAISTVQTGPQQYGCPSDFTAAPTATWSTDTLTTDCAGHYTLCYTLKAGSAASPQASDCVVAQACAENDYTTANQPQPWPDLPGWISSGAETECAQIFTDSGGYGEKSVSGTPTGCSALSKVLSRVSYCPLACNQPNPPASCAGCVSGPTDGGF